MSTRLLIADRGKIACRVNRNFLVDAATETLILLGHKMAPLQDAAE